jgi:type I restriction enzyme S subunit
MISRSSIDGAYPTKRLKDVVEFLDSMRRPITESERRSGPYPYYGANGQQGTIDDFIFDEPLVLLAEDGGYFDTPDRGIAYRISGKTWVNNHAHVLRPRPEMDLAFLCRVLENYDVTPWVTGTTRGKLTQAGASEIIVPLPPLPEQRRIAAILDKAALLRHQRRAALALLDTLTQSIFLDMFGDPATNPKGWPTSALENITSRTRTGLKRGPFGGALKKEIFVETGYKVYEQQHAIYKDHESGKYFITERKYREMEAFAIEPGDFIVSCSGTVGRIYRLPPFAPKGVINQALLRVTLDEERIEPAFFEALFESDEFQRSLLGNARGTGINNFPPMERIRAIGIILPPLSLQHTFAYRVAAVEKLKAAHRAALAQLDELFAALQHRAFKGEL